MTSIEMAPGIATERWVPTADNFGTRLAMIRQHKGWNLTEASVTCGLGQNDWARYEAGVSPRKLADVVKKISDVSGVDPNWLLWGPNSVGGGQRFVGSTPTRQGWKLPGLDSNQEPIGSRPVASLTERIAARAKTPPVDRDQNATITEIGA